MSTKARLAIVVLVIIGALVGRYYFNPSTDAVGGSGAPIAQVTVPQLSPVALEGQRLFEQNCASCHGKTAAGQQGIAPPLVNNIYRTRFHGDIAFKMAANNGVRSHHWKFGNMPPVEGVSDADITKIVAYVRELQVANGVK